MGHVEMRRVYVIGAFIPNGGTFMAYHLGLIVSRYIGGEPIAVRVGSEDPDSGVFDYPEKMPLISLEEFREMARPSDVLIMNPSFSHLLLGPNFNGFKLMYVQHFNTYRVIDGWFKSYVSVSDCVRRFLQCAYGMDSPVIFPFVDLMTATPPRRWEERPENRVLVITKGEATQQETIFKSIRKRIADHRPDIVFDRLAERMKHKDLLEFVAGYRYVLSLSCAEGFGLMPLESMGVGAAVIAFDAGGGKSYMIDQINCWCTSYPNIDLLADRLLYAVNNPDAAAQVSQNGIRQARMFSYERFRDAWMDHLRGCPGLK